MSTKQPDAQIDTIPPHPMEMVKAAIEKGMDPHSILDFIERVKKSEAQAAYTKAMIACQAEMPIILHDSDNPHTKSSYVKLETIQAKIKPIYSKHGFTLSWDEADCPKQGFARLICYVMHEDGHIQRHQGDFPLDGHGAKGGGVMSPVQGRVSSNTYAQRDMIRSIFNLTIAGQDLDGSHTSIISQAQRQEIDNRLAEIESVWGQRVPQKRIDEFLNVHQVKALAELPAVKFSAMMSELDRWMEKAKAASKGDKK